jgi:predicted DNA-binding transcriptional regulator AlpA
MRLPVRDTIRELRLSRVARRMGLPVSTLFRWMTEDRIPGKGRAHQWRVAQFEAAVAELRAETRQEAPR